MGRDAVGVLGSSHSAHALCAVLSSRGHQVTLWARDLTKLAQIKAQKFLRSEGQLVGQFNLHQVTDSLEELCNSCDILFLATVTTAYREIVSRLAPYLRSRHVIVAFSSKLCGSLEIDSVLRGQGVRGVTVLETDALFACRLKEPGVIWIRGVKAWNLYSCPQKSATLEFGPLLNRYFDGLHPAHNLVQRGLTDFGAHAHAVITLANISKIDRGEEFLFYYDGLSARTICLLETVAEEVRRVAEAYDTEILPLAFLLDRYYGCETSDLLTAMRTVPNYRYSKAPTELAHRYLKEDVLCTLLPLTELAAKAGVKTPLVESVIHFAAVLNGLDLKSEGRRLKDLGLSELSHKEIVQWMLE